MAWRVIIDRDPSMFADRLFVVQDGTNEQFIVRPLELQKRERHLPAEPTYVMDEGQSDEFLQAFADAAWERGIRPRQLEDQRNQVKAMESHLTDLRRVSFKLLKIDP